MAQRLNEIRPDYSPDADAIFSGPENTFSEAYLQLAPELKLSLEEKRQIVNEFIEVGVLYYIAAGEPPTLANLESIHSNSPMDLAYQPDTMLAILSEGLETEEVDVPEMEAAYRSWVEVDAIAEIEADSLKIQGVLDEIAASVLPQELFKKKELVEDSRTKNIYRLSDEEMSDDEKIITYKKYRFAEMLLDGRLKPEKRQTALLQIVHGFNFNTGRSVGSAFMGEIQKASGQIRKHVYNLSYSQIKEAAERPEWIDYFYPELKDKTLDTISWAADYEKLEAQKEQREKFISQGYEFYIEHGRLPLEADLRKAGSLPRPLVVGAYFHARHIFNEQVLFKAQTEAQRKLVLAN